MQSSKERVALLVRASVIGRASIGAAVPLRTRVEKEPIRRLPSPLTARPVSASHSSRAHRIMAVLCLVGAVLTGWSGTAHAGGGGPAVVGLTNPTDFNPTSQHIAVGSAAPDFSLATIDGQRYSLSSLRGRPVVIEFIAIWCAPCQQAQAVLQEVNTRFASRGIRVLGILGSPYGPKFDTSHRTDFSPATARDIVAFQQKYPANVHILIDPTFATVNRYGITAYPTYYIINRRGITGAVIVGGETADELAVPVLKATAS